MNIVKRAQATLQQGTEAIRQHIQQMAVVGSDETGIRVQGHTQWQWVFQTPQGAYDTIRPSCAAQVVQGMGEQRLFCQHRL